NVGCVTRVSTPFWPIGFPHEDSRPKPGTLSIIRQSETNKRAQVMNDGRKAGSLRKAEEDHRKNLRTKDLENDGAGTVALFIIESLKHRKWSRTSPGEPSGRAHGKTEITTIPEHNNDPRAPQDIQGTLRKSRSQVPRPPRANGPRPRATSQRSPMGHKGHRNERQDTQRAIGDRGMLNSAPNVQTGQNRLLRRRVARTVVHTTHGDIRLIQILVIQAFQVFKLIGRRRSGASSIKFQAFSGFPLN
ncbi:hypothetical protein CRG98_039258, partial [Punica granatum]